MAIDNRLRDAQGNLIVNQIPGMTAGRFANEKGLIVDQIPGANTPLPIPGTKPAITPLPRFKPEATVEQPLPVVQKTPVIQGQPGLGGGGGAPQFLNTVASNRKALENAGFIQVIRGLNSRLESPAFSKYGSQSIDESTLQPGGFTGQERLVRAGGFPQVAAQELASQAKLGAAKIMAGAQGERAAATVEAAQARVKPIATEDQVSEALSQAVVEQQLSETPEDLASATANVQRLTNMAKAIQAAKAASGSAFK